MCTEEKAEETALPVKPCSVPSFPSTYTHTHTARTLSANVTSVCEAAAAAAAQQTDSTKLFGPFANGKDQHQRMLPVLGSEYEEEEREEKADVQKEEKTTFLMKSYGQFNYYYYTTETRKNLCVDASCVQAYYSVCRHVNLNLAVKM